MTEPRNYESERRRVAERFESTIAEEGLTVSGLLEADELRSRYGDQIEALSQEAFDHDSAEEARDWVERCTQPMGFRAVVLTNQQGELAGFTWGTPLAEDPANDMEMAADFVTAERQAQDVATGDALYSSALAITPEHRRKGLGSGLALAAIRLCRDQLHTDGALLFYRTLPDNTAANRASEMLGAQRTDIISPESGKELWVGHIPVANTPA